MMNLIHEVLNEYNENILTDNWKNSNYVNWVATNLAGTIMEESDSRRYEEGKSLRLYINGYDTGDTSFQPVAQLDTAFVAPKTGNYLFSMRVYLPGTAFLPEVEGELNFMNWDTMTLLPTIPFKIGNNTDPEFSFSYNKWQTFYTQVFLTAGTTYVLDGGTIFAQPTYAPGVVEIFFDGFKMEYISDRNFVIPTYYTKPSANDNTSSGYVEYSGGPITINPYDKTIYISSGTFTVNLPTSKGIKGKEFEIINAGNGIITLNTVGGGEIIGNSGSTSYVIASQCGVVIQSNGEDWRIKHQLRMETLNRTQWVQNIALTSISNASSLNLLTLIPNASKFANGTDGGFNELNITGGNRILTNWTGKPTTHHIRITLTISTGSDQHYTLTLRRFADNSVLGAAQLNRNADTGLQTIDFITYTYSDVDPFVTGGFYISLDNNSGASVDLITSLNLFITTYFK